MSNDDWNWQKAWPKIEAYLGKCIPEAGTSLIVASPAEQISRGLAIALAPYVLFDYRICVGCLKNQKGFTKEMGKNAKARLKMVYNSLGLED